MRGSERSHVIEVPKTLYRESAKVESIPQNRISERSQVLDLPRISWRESAEIVKSIPQERISERSQVMEALFLERLRERREHMGKESSPSIFVNVRIVRRFFSSDRRTSTGEVSLLTRSHVACVSEHNKTKEKGLSTCVWGGLQVVAHSENNSTSARLLGTQAREIARCMDSCVDFAATERAGSAMALEFVRYGSVCATHVCTCFQGASGSSRGVTHKLLPSHTGHMKPSE